MLLDVRDKRFLAEFVCLEQPLGVTEVLQESDAIVVRPPRIQPRERVTVSAGVANDPQLAAEGTDGLLVVIERKPKVAKSPGEHLELRLEISRAVGPRWPASDPDPVG